MTGIGWVAFGIAFCWMSFILGFQAGRDSAERKCAATIADLRVQVKRLAGRGIDHADDRRPE